MKHKGKWMFVRWDGDTAVYAMCMDCRFTYGCFESQRDDNGALSFYNKPSKPFRYCPNCGLRMKKYDGKVVYRYNNEGEFVEKYRVKRGKKVVVE